MFLDVNKWGDVAADWWRSNAREGIFCFWTIKEVKDYLKELGSNAREGIFCFWTCDSQSRWSSLYLRSNAREGIFCFWTHSGLGMPYPAGLWF